MKISKILLCWLIFVKEFREIYTETKENRTDFVVTTDFQSVLSFANSNDNNITIGTVVQCEIEKIDQQSQQDNTPNSHLKFWTEGSENYIYFPIETGQNCLNFKIQADKNAVIMLTDIPSKFHNKLWQIFLGGYLSPSISLIQRTNIYHIAVQISTPNILNGTELRGFWLNWNSTIGLLEVGRENELTPFLSYVEPFELFPINYIGIRTWKVPGYWIMESSKCTSKPDDKSSSNIHQIPVQSDLTVSNVTITETKSKCHLIDVKPTEIVNSRLPTLIILQRNFLNQIRTDFQNFNKHYYRSKDFLQMCLNELELIFRKSTNIQNDILGILVNEEASPATIKDYLKENLFEELRTIYFEYYGILQVELTKIDAVTMTTATKEDEIEHSIDELPFQYFEYASSIEGCLNFRVKANRDFYIRLSSTSSSGVNQFIELIIGGQLNTKSSIRKFNSNSNLVDVSTIDILNGNEFIGFWINWRNGSIKLGKTGEHDPILSWKEADMFPVKFVGVANGPGVHGQWIVESMKCEQEEIHRRSWKKAVLGAP